MKDVEILDILQVAGLEGRTVAELASQRMVSEAMVWQAVSRLEYKRQIRQLPLTKSGARRYIHADFAPTGSNPSGPSFSLSAYILQCAKEAGPKGITIPDVFESLFLGRQRVSALMVDTAFTTMTSHGELIEKPWEIGKGHNHTIYVHPNFSTPASTEEPMEVFSLHEHILHKLTRAETEGCTPSQLFESLPEGITYSIPFIKATCDQLVARGTANRYEPAKGRPEVLYIHPMHDGETYGPATPPTLGAVSQTIDIPSAQEPEAPPTEVVKPPKSDKLHALLSHLESTTLARADRAKREEAVLPLIASEPYSLERLEVRILEASSEMARSALTIGATLLAIKTVEGHGTWEAWWNDTNKRRPFGLRMAYRFIGNARKVLADQRLFPVIELGASKAELLLKSMSEEEAEELAEQGTIRGRPIDQYDAMGRRELEQELRALRGEKDRAEKKAEELKEKLKAAAVDHEEKVQMFTADINALKKEIAQSKIPRHPDEQQLSRLKTMKEYLERLRGISHLTDAQTSAEIFSDAPDEHLAQAHTFYQEAYILAKRQLLTFEKHLGFTSEAGMDAALTAMDGLHLGTMEAPPGFFDDDRAPSGTIPFPGQRGD